MKNFFKSLVVGALLLGSVGCSDMFKEEIYDIYNELDNINARIDSLCNAVNTNIASLQTIIDVMQDNDYVDSITPIVEGGETVGYEIVFTQSGSVKIYHGKKGETGATGHTPVIGVKQAEDGRWYWTVDGEYLLDGEGDKILAEAIDGEDGATGADGITPQLKVEGDYWYISYDNKATWERLGKATGEAGKDGDSMFQSVNYNDEYVELVLIDGTVLRIPTWASHMLLVDEIAKINSNISAIQAAIEALESNDYVQKVTPVKDEDGNVIGYTLQFAFTGDVTIYHGEDGKDGEDGEDGKDGEDGEDGKDGYTPVIGARQHPDGIWYWTVDGEWLLDTNGNRVKTTGDKGADGTIGITPELKIQDDYWYVSYDKGQTWTKLGKAKGEDGAAGSAGTAGDAFFKGVDTSDEYYVKFTLADGTVIKIPTWKAYQELADLVDQLNTNFKSLNDIVVGIQNNDYITGYTPIVDPQTNEEIGYTLHFAKSGDITIYHGKTGQDGVAPDISIQEHPKYGLCWTYNGEFIIDPGTGKPVALPSDGKNGKDGVSPKLKIEDGEWWVSYNNGSSWTCLGQATGDTGATGGSGDSFFKSIVPEYATDTNGNVLKDELGRPIVAYIVMTLAGENEGDEVTYKVPTEYVTSELNKRIAALETQFTAIETIVKAIQNAEYIKSVVEQYDGPALVGYKITFIKYTIENGTLIPSERDVYIGSASNAGSKVEYAKDENGDYYWVIDGSPLKDEDGNILYIEGKTPTVEINKDGYWVINGVNTGVKARGEDGENGENGSNASSLFSDVVLDGSYYVFTFTDGREPIKVPSWKAFEDLQKAVTQLTATVESFTELIQGNKYIEKVEALSENKGYTLFVKEFNADTQTWDTKSYTIYNGTDGSNGTTPVVPTISVAQDPENPEDQNYYWKVGDNWLTDAQGNKIRANALDGDPGLDALTPEFRIVNGTLYYKYTNEGDDKWRELANVQGSSAAVNIIFQNPANPLESEWIEIRFGEGENDKIKIPTWVAYEKIQDTISSLTTNVEAISALVYGHKYVESFKELENGGYEFVVRYYDEAAKEWKTEAHTIDVTTADEIGVKQDTDGNYYWTKGGEWLLDAAGNKVMVDGSAERTLEFKSENDGKLYYKYSDETEWIVLDIAVSESVVESNVVVKEENGKVTVTVLDDAGLVLYTFSAPSWEAFEALQGRVIALEEQVTDIYDLIDQLTTNYQALSGDVKNMAAKLEKCKFIGEYEYDEERKGHVIYLVDIDGNKLQNAAGEYETIFIADGEDGEDFDASMLSFTEVDGEYFWTYNGEMLVDAAGKPVKAHGADGRTPEFRISNDVLQYRYEGEGDDAWQSLGNVKGSASAANITVENPADPDHSMWIMIQYTYTDAQGNEIVEEVKLPTYYAYEKALDEIAAIKSTIDMVETFLKGNKFVSDYELTYDNNGMVSGCTVTTAEYKLQEDGSYRVFTSETEFNPSQTMSVKLENDVWYLVFYNEKGEEVKRPLSQSAFTFVPEVAVNNGYIYVAKVSEPGNDYADTEKWECLGAVVELLGGETGSAQGALKSVEEIDGYICFTFSNGEVLKVPSEAKFQEVLDRLDEVEDAVETIQGTITEINRSLASLSSSLSDHIDDYESLSDALDDLKANYKFIGGISHENGTWTIEVVNGNNESQDQIVLSDGKDGDSVSPYQGEDGEWYWMVGTEKTTYPVTSKPEFRINAEGVLQYTFIKNPSETDWTDLDVVKGDAAAANVVFSDNESAPEVEKDVTADKALWVGVQYGEDPAAIVWMPTYAYIQSLLERISGIDERIDGIQTTVNGLATTMNELSSSLSNHISDYESLSDALDDLKANYKFIGGISHENGTWTIKVVNGNNESQDQIVLSDGKDGDSVSPYQGEDGEWYWMVGTEKTTYPVTSKPEFRINAEGVLQYTFIKNPSETDWTDLDVVKGDAAAANVVFSDNESAPEVEKDVTAEKALWVGIQYGEDENAIVWMPTKRNFDSLASRVNVLESNIDALSTFVNDKSFISKIEQISDGDGNVIGFDATIMKFTAQKGNDGIYTYSSEPQEDKITYRHGYSVSVIEENGNKYWVINGDTTNKILVRDPSFVPQIHIGTDGMVYISISPDATIDNLTNTELWVKIDPKDTNVTPKDAVFTPVKDENDVVLGYEIKMYDSENNMSTITVPAYFKSPIISFSDTSGTTITDLNIGGETLMDVTCRITGSFPDDDNHPKIYAACEGHFTSSIKSLNRDSNTQYTVVITVKPTTAYDSELNGKLTVYCPYYGNTGIGQLNLTAQGAGIKIESVDKSGNDLNATILLDGIVEKSGEKMQVKVVGGDFDPKDPWISMGNVNNPSNSKIEQTLNLTPYVIGSQEDLEKGQVRQERTCTLAVVTPSGREAGYVAINQTPIINLADQGSANCYIISAPGRYMLPARKGNAGPLWSTCPSNVSIVKTSTDDGKNTVNLEFSLLNYQKEDYIVFDVPNTVQNGNTVIALKEGDTILWSWHLWFCKDESRPDNNLNSYVNRNNTYTVMNRAIGATKTMTEYLDGSPISVWTDGLYYQWGRKDPFLVNEDGALVGSEVASSGTYNSSTDKLIYNSNWTSTDGWGATKSKNDPCPPGYRVPNNSIWKDKYEPGTLEKAANAIGVFSYNLESTPDLTKAINYSYSSYIQSDGSLKKDEKEFVPFETGYSFTSLGQEGTIPVKLPLLGTYDFPRLAEDKFTMNNMKIQVTRKEGRLWGLNSSNSSYLYYYGKVLGLDELTDEAALEKILQIGEYTHERRVVTNYSLRGLSTKDLRALLSSLRNGSLSEEFLESIAVWGAYNTVTPNMSKNDKSALLAKLLLSANDDINTYDHTKVTTNINPAEASQIRCIKE